VIDVSEKHIAFIFRVKQSILLEMPAPEGESTALLHITHHVLSLVMAYTPQKT
jgi:hypothetical protein